MRSTNRIAIAVGAVVACAAGALGTGALPAGADTSFARGDRPAANPRVGVQDNVLASGLHGTPVAWGSLPLANPDTSAGVTHYGYDTAQGSARPAAGGPLTQDPHEAYKTEPDKNVYLVLGGRHFLYQGHEGGPQGYVTRVDLDESDPAHRVALVADRDDAGQPLPTFDGITWDPFTQQLLLTAESASPAGGVWAVHLDASGDAVPAGAGQAVRLAALGSGGYEGIQNDADGDVWLVEDIGGKAPAGHPGGKYPNSYVYRFVPADKGDLTKGGTLQALQVHRADGTPVTAAELKSGIDGFLTDLHAYGNSFATSWVDLTPGVMTAPYGFNATAAAAQAGATPFKRPENGVFRPGTGFREFYFTETGDTNATSDLPGRWGGVFRLSQSAPGARSGTLTAAYLGDLEHTGLDNIAFATADQVLVVEDAGDTLHGQRNALDSGYVLDLRGNQARTPDRWLAEGRDASATYDALWSPGYNDGDNEVTGIHVSNGDATAAGILGAQVPQPFADGWRVFFTQQHGDNVTWEVSPRS